MLFVFFVPSWNTVTYCESFQGTLEAVEFSCVSPCEVGRWRSDVQKNCPQQLKNCIKLAWNPNQKRRWLRRSSGSHLAGFGVLAPFSPLCLQFQGWLSDSSMDGLWWVHVVTTVTTAMEPCSSQKVMQVKSEARWFMLRSVPLRVIPGRQKTNCLPTPPFDNLVATLRHLVFSIFLLWLRHLIEKDGLQQ